MHIFHNHVSWSRAARRIVLRVHRAPCMTSCRRTMALAYCTSPCEGWVPVHVDPPCWLIVAVTGSLGNA
jgi:hypothetical protein